MKSRATLHLGRWFAGVYVGWWALVYFTADHNWWPIFLYPLLYPWSSLFEHGGDTLLQPAVFTVAERLAIEPYLLWDRVAGGIYLLGGTLWFGLLGHLGQRLIRKFRRPTTN